MKPWQLFAIIGILTVGVLLIETVLQKLLG